MPPMNDTVDVNGPFFGCCIGVSGVGEGCPSASAVAVELDPVLDPSSPDEPLT